MEQIIRIGMDTSKNIFQLHGVDAAEQVVLRKQLRAQADAGVFRQAAADGGRDGGVRGVRIIGRASLRGSGHEVKLMRAAIREALRQAEQERRARCRGDVRGDEPADDAVRAGEDGGAAGGADAGGHPRAMVAPAHAAEQRDPRLCGGVRADRGQGARQDRAAAGRIAQDESVPALARELFALQGQEYAQLQAELKGSRPG